ncbi:MAG: sigma-70 family RNA polymerase sigma factor [Acidobacteriota bacterium]
MPEPPPNDVTRLIADWRAGDAAALDELLPLVYEELRRLAASHLRRERSDHTLQTTALVHEAYLKLLGGAPVRLANRSQFFQFAAQAMRRILVDHARRLQAKKRWDPSQKISLDSVGEVEVPLDDRLLAVHDALERLAAIRPRQAQLVEMRYFGGFGLEEIAECLSLSRATVARDWQVARRWLFAQLASGKKSAE